ncbi:nucleic-acid-binding protein from transposon X-element [Trichonephila clavipes]|nr:nucleic-acid-binding protein from transposon X-element [Trichonephila clavipes]
MDNHRSQMKVLDDIYPHLRNKLTCEYVKLYIDTDTQCRELIHKMDELKFQFFAIKSKAERPIKVVIKGLPRDSKTEDLHNDLTQLGYTVDKVSQLIGSKTKQPLPIFLVSLPRNIHNAKIFDLSKVSYINVTVDGYDGKGVTQCYSCIIVSIIRQKTAISLLGAINVAKSNKRENAKFKELRIDTALIVKHMDTWLTTMAALNSPNHVKEQAQILTLTPIQLTGLLGREYHMLKTPTLPTLKKHNRWCHVTREILLSR